MGNETKLRSKKNVMIDGEMESETVKSGPMFIDKDGLQSEEEIPKEGQIPAIIDKKGKFIKKLRSQDSSLLDSEDDEDEEVE